VGTAVGDGVSVDDAVGVADPIATPEGTGVGARVPLGAGHAVRIMVGVGEGVGGSVGLELELGLRVGLGLGLGLALPDTVGDGLGVGMYQQNDPEGVGEGRRVAPGGSDSSPTTTPESLALGSTDAFGSTWPFQLSLGLPEAPELRGIKLLLPLSGAGSRIDVMPTAISRTNAMLPNRKIVLRRCVRGVVRGDGAGLAMAVLVPGECDPRLWPSAVPASRTVSKAPLTAPATGLRWRSCAARTAPSLEKSGAGLAASSTPSISSWWARMMPGISGTASGTWIGTAAAAAEAAIGDGAAAAAAAASALAPGAGRLYFRCGSTGSTGGTGPLAGGATDVAPATGASGPGTSRPGART
jgi:hypothetical protein